MLRADRVADAARERVVERDARPQAHEQHDAHVALPVLSDGDALLDLGQPFDLAVDLGGADAHAAGVEHRVRSAEDHEAVVLGVQRVVAVTPDAGKAFEIGRAVAAAVGVAPEAERHGREGRGADELALFPANRAALLVVTPASPCRVPADWISPRYTGSQGLPRQKQEMMSVPPEIDARWTSRLMRGYT